MRALQIDTYGDEDVVTSRDIPVPEIGPDEVLVRLGVSGINFMDIHTRQGKYRDSRTYEVSVPTTLGMEGGGIIEKVGRDVRDLHPGQRVVYCISWGSYADYAAVPARRVVPVPDELTLRRATTALFHGLTAHYLARDVGQLGPGVSCLVHSASGGIGQILVQMGVACGASVYATTSTSGKAEVARSRGASEVFGYEDFAARIREATGGRGVDVVFDPVGAPTFRQSLQALRRKGLMVAFGSVGGSVRDLDPIELGEAGSVFLTRPRLADHIASAEDIRRRADEVFSWLLSGELEISCAGEFGFDEVLEVHRRLENRQLVGKPLLSIDPAID
ncbi:quinone oxidoreductase (plasmid) [Salipiger sp. H15]|uniref:Quinone oxidoreductase n=1 Tax=Alloyangia sp. H15 TaxID=3029062 RepID=A0AAU8AQR5_9RHOB